MQEWMLNGVIVVLMLGITYALSSEGAWGAALMFFNVLFAGLITFNFYEPLAAQFLAWGMSGAWGDFLGFWIIFLVSLVILRVCTDMFAPGMVRLPTPIYHLGRLLFGLATSAVTMGILLCALQIAPVHRQIFGLMDYSTQPPFKFGLDRMWLAFVQRTTGNIFTNHNKEEGEPVDDLFDTANVFDPKGAWLIEHQNHRPYPEGGTEGIVPPPDPEAPAADPSATPAPGG